MCYIGYEDDFIFVYEPDKMTRPLNDNTAKLFLEHPVKFVESLIKGNNVEEAKNKAEKVLRDNLIRSLGSTSDSSLARYLWWDLRSFVACGDLNSTI